MKKLLAALLAALMVSSAALAAPLGSGVSLMKTAGSYDPHNLSDFGYRTVKISASDGCLVFQTSPGGSVMDGYQFWNGDTIYVNLTWREKGYALAYQNGTYGFVDASYIDWGTSKDSGSSYNPRNLSEFGYRTVKIGSGNGCLVFQNSPGGSVINGFQFWNGDTIYVNLTYRERGYALAYQNGTYGYVDASYIDWGSSGSASGKSAYDLANFGYRKVKISASEGCLVFQSAPAGSVINGFQFWNGDTIYVNLTYRDRGYALAYQNGTYGYVDASYIDWGSSAGSSGGSAGSSSAYDPHNLSDFGYRTVSISASEGCLVFQTSPGGSVINGHQYWNGDKIFVNLTWREKGYAIAYDNGAYGYVDASYIIW